MVHYISLITLFALALLAPVKGAPAPFLYLRHEGHDNNSTSTTNDGSQTDFKKQNGLDAQQLNAKFSAVKETDSCKDGEMACVNSAFAQCIGAKWALTPCASGTVCVALPLVNKPGTSLSCDSKADALARLEAAGVQGGLTGSDQTPNPGNSTTTTSAPSGDGNQGDDQNCSDESQNNGTQTNDNEDDCDDDGDATSGGDDTDCDEDDNGASTLLPSKTTPAASASATVLAANTNAEPSATATTMCQGAEASSSAGYLEKRQISHVTLFTTTPSATIVPPSSTVLASGSPPTAASISTVLPSSPVSVSSSAGGAESTCIVIGSDGIRTVTVVSTVTVGCTGAPTLAPSATVAPVSSSPATVLGPVVTVITSTIGGPAGTASPSFPAPISSATLSPVSSVVVASPSSTTRFPIFSSASATTVRLPSSSAGSGISFSFPSASGSVPTSVVSNGASGFSFSTSPSPTPAAGDVNNGAQASQIDVSKLLTATIGYA